MPAGRGSRLGDRRAGALALAFTLVAGGGAAIGASGNDVLISRESASAGGEGADDDFRAASVSDGPARDVANVYRHER